MHSSLHSLLVSSRSLGDATAAADAAVLDAADVTDAVSDNLLLVILLILLVVTLLILMLVLIL